MLSIIIVFVLTFKRRYSKINCGHLCNFISKNITIAYCYKLESLSRYYILICLPVVFVDFFLIEFTLVFSLSSFLSHPK